MGASIGSSAAWALPAEPSAVGQLRRRAVAFSTSAGAPDELIRAIELAVSETVTNAVLHAYPRTAPGCVRVRCSAEGDRIVVEVSDDGVGVGTPSASPGLGHGLATVGALARTLDVGAGPGGRGTVVMMSFGADERPAAAPGLEALCDLALETVADVSCVDVVHGGVLRRAVAEVAGDAELTAWLRRAVPPAKPGTATWAALREGGARLVVHDPSVPRSPGGTGERLDLTWWIAVPLEDADGMPAALWGLGGRAGGRPVPSDAVVRTLAAAGRGNLAKPENRARLGAALCVPGR